MATLKLSAWGLLCSFHMKFFPWSHLHNYIAFMALQQLTVTFTTRCSILWSSTCTSPPTPFADVKTMSCKEVCKFHWYNGREYMNFANLVQDECLRASINLLFWAAFLFHVATYSCSQLTVFIIFSMLIFAGCWHVTQSNRWQAVDCQAKGNKEIVR